MPDHKRAPLNVALGAKAWRQGLDAALAQSDELRLNFIEVSPIHRAFAPMARAQSFDVAEMAIVTALQAIAYGKPLVLLPVAIAARFQQRCLIAHRAAPLSPADLPGRRIGVRAYTQTTGMWIRGILADDYGVDSAFAHWVTQEGAHLAEYHDPDFVTSAPTGRDLLDLLRTGDIDAAILGNDLPDDPDFVPVIADPEAAARAWFARHGVVPVNHMLMVRQDIAAARPDVIRALWQALRRAKPASASVPDMAPFGVAAVTPALAMVLRHCARQHLLPRPLAVDDIFAPARAVLGDNLD